MKKIFLLGAGRSCTSLIKYLKTNSDSLNISLVVTDRDENIVSQKIEGFDRARFLKIDLNDSIQLSNQIKKSDLVISMLPAFMHDEIAALAVENGTPFLSASYVSEAIKKLDTKAKLKGIPIVMEMGLDPGIDHMSAK